MSTRTTRRWLVGIALVACVGAGLWLAWPEDETRTVQLPDGWTIQLCSLTYGIEERFVDGPIWKRTLARVLPTNATTALGWRFLTLSGHDTNFGLLAWFEWRGRRDTPVPPHFLSVVDANGLESMPEIGRYTLNRSNGTALLGFKLKSFPRRAPELTLRLYESVRPNILDQVADFSVGNPARSTRFPPPFASAALPQTQRDEHLSVTLLGLRTGLEATGVVNTTAINKTWSELVFRVGTNEPAWAGTNMQAPSDWDLRMIEVTDAAGNYLHKRDPDGRILWQTSQRFAQRRNDGVILLRDALWPGESWRVRAEFVPSSPGAFPPEHTWTVKNISVPDVLSTMPLNVSNVVRGCHIHLLSIAGRNTHAALGPPGTVLTVGRMSSGATNPVVRALFHPPARGYQLRVIDAVDGFGHPVPLFVQSRSAEEIIISPRGLREGDTVDLTFGVARSHAVEFIAQPTILRTNVAHWSNR